MNPDIKARWVAALRSGDYRQGQGQLMRGMEWPLGSGKHYCCLGVLCEIAVKDGVIVRKGDTFRDPNDPFDYEKSYLPLAVQRWAGLDERNPGIPDGTLAGLNDAGASFSRIANVIEEYL